MQNQTKREITLDTQLRTVLIDEGISNSPDVRQVTHNGRAFEPCHHTRQKHTPQVTGTSHVPPEGAEEIVKQKSDYTDCGYWNSHTCMPESSGNLKESKKYDNKGIGHILLYQCEHKWSSHP